MSESPVAAASAQTVSESLSTICPGCATSATTRAPDLAGSHAASANSPRFGSRAAIVHSRCGAREISLDAIRATSGRRSIPFRTTKETTRLAPVPADTRKRSSSAGSPIELASSFVSVIGGDWNPSSLTSRVVPSVDSALSRSLAAAASDCTPAG
jgi:hypothetical protein